MTTYEEQIALITKEIKENPYSDIIAMEWSNSRGLFQHVGSYAEGGGCLTQIKGVQLNAIIKGKIDENLTRAIRKDNRIPSYGNEIRIHHIPVFLEWREVIDKLEST